MKKRKRINRVATKLAGSTEPRKVNVLMLLKVSVPVPPPIRKRLIDPVGFPTLNHALAAIIAK